MSRSYKIRAKSHRVYNVEEVQKLYTVCRNTVSNWVGVGLNPSPSRGPQVFRGSELNRFHKDRREQGRKNVRLGQFFCLRCKVAVAPIQSSVGLHRKGKKCWASGICSECNSNIVKILDATGYDRLKEAIHTNTNLTEIDERNGEALACVGIKKSDQQIEPPSMNDQVIHFWQLYAARYDSKTVDAHLASIRDFENFMQGHCFSLTSVTDIGTYRRLLLEKGEKTREDGGLSSSTIRHRISHLRSFFAWLIKVDGYKRLDANISEYFVLPRKNMAKVLPRSGKTTPSIDDALAMIHAMPTKTRAQRRDQAIIACAFLTGLRAAALSTLRLKHLDCEAKTAVQDALEMRAKNGKSFTICWFPVPRSISEVVIQWKIELIKEGFKCDDSLFPDVRYLSKKKRCGETIPPQRTAAAVNRAFKLASREIEKSYSPHSARHCLAALGGELCNSAKERKAWSLNLGHESTETTEKYYGKMTDKTRLQLLSSFGDRSEISNDKKDLMLRYFLHELVRGSPEFKEARQLIKEREAAIDEMVVVDY